VIAAVESALARFDPRPHWGKLFTMAPDLIAAQYPQLPAFRTLAAEYDPHRRFGNAFLDTYIYGPS
jgi:alditol oxidase